MNKPWTDSSQLDLSAGLIKLCISLIFSVLVVYVIIWFMFQVVLDIFDKSILKY